MAGTVHNLAWDWLDGKSTNTDGNVDVMVTLSVRQHEQFLFAIDRSHNLTLDLGKIYLAKGSLGLRARSARNGHEATETIVPERAPCSPRERPRGFFKGQIETDIGIITYSN